MNLYKRNDKCMVYWLIAQYLNAEINEKDFCDEYYYSYSLEINKQQLNEIEKEVFSKLDEVVKIKEGEVTRKNHFGTLYSTFGPTSTEWKEEIIVKPENR